MNSIKCIIEEAALDCHGDPSRVGLQGLNFTTGEAMVTVVSLF